MGNAQRSTELELSTHDTEGRPSWIRPTSTTLAASELLTGLSGGLISVRLQRRQPEEVSVERVAGLARVRLATVARVSKLGIDFGDRQTSSGLFQ